MAYSKIISAQFWLVFGEGHSIDFALDMLKESSEADIDGWADLGSRSFRKFDEIITASINGDDTLLNLYATKYTWFDRLRSRLSRIPRMKITFT